ncbi:hypothetical protein KDA_71700 [Dictyobacter alpinus]|uniref:Activator of Hsp90 ATPase homologue 1/2-like C-terminal domain-containing protein n=1 Tax=Dictyobacter alpinus TaxID=2014873 RepID=A0A402BK27_9CHLR|nr:SRPBCC domain-containing protein [Dictyobacter alpinus]GCE31686.1 hypothetical protein KDA_71700 [Dictyobacter alpinus]
MKSHDANKETSQYIVGLTRTAGFQIGVRRTFTVSIKTAWDFLISAKGQRIWLGANDPLQFIEGSSYTTADGTSGMVRVVNPGVNLRLTWQPPSWTHASTIQIRTIQSGANTTISFHQERLAGALEREQMRRHWQQVLTHIEIQMLD